MLKLLMVDVPPILQSPCVNFTNVLRAAFALIDPESIKNAVKSSVSFTLLGSARVKAIRRMLMKLSPYDGGTINNTKAFVKIWALNLMEAQKNCGT